MARMQIQEKWIVVEFTPEEEEILKENWNWMSPDDPKNEHPSRCGYYWLKGKERYVGPVNIMDLIS